MSVYLSLPKKTKNLSQDLIQQFHIAFHSTFQEIETDSLRENLLYIKGFLETCKNTKGYKSLVIFAGGNKLWEILYSKYEIPTQVHVSHRPYMDPLLEKEETAKRYLVVLADKSQATYFTLYHGMVEQQGHIYDPSVPQNVKATSMEDSQDKMFRRVLDHLHKHLITVTNRVTMVINHKQIHGVVIGGHRELLHKIEEHLPQDLRQKVIGNFVCELSGDMNDVSQKSNQIIQRMQKSSGNHQPSLSAIA